MTVTGTTTSTGQIVANGGLAVNGTSTLSVPLPTTSGGTGLSTVGSNNQVLAISGGVPAWITPTFSGTVTSVAASVPTFLSITGSPITTSGTLAISLSGSALPTTSGGTGLTTLGSNGQVLTISSGAPAWVTPTNSGTVTSVAATVPAFLSITGSPVTSSGTLAISLSGSALPVTSGGTGGTTATGTGILTLNNAPSFVNSLLVNGSTFANTLSLNANIALGQIDLEAWSTPASSTKYNFGINRFGGNVTIGDTSSTTSIPGSTVTSSIVLPLAAGAAKISLTGPLPNLFQYDGFGTKSSIVAYQISDTTKSHVFYTGVSNTTDSELFRITGTGFVGIGLSTPNAPLHLPASLANRKIVLYEVANNDHQYYGSGVNSSVYRFQVAATTADFVWYAGTSSTTSTEIARISGTGNFTTGPATFTSTTNALHPITSTNTATAALVPVGRFLGGNSTSQTFLINGKSETAGDSSSTVFTYVSANNIANNYSFNFFGGGGQSFKMYNEVNSTSSNWSGDFRIGRNLIATPRYGRVYVPNSTQNFLPGTDKPIDWTSAVAGPLTISLGNRLQNTSGYDYVIQFNYNIVWDQATSGIAKVYLQLSTGECFGYSAGTISNFSGAYPGCSGSCIISLPNGTYVTAVAGVSTGFNLSLVGNADGDINTTQMSYYILN